MDTTHGTLTLTASQTPAPQADRLAARRAEYEAMVKRPGKFEGEPCWVPYYYELLLDGDGECHCTCPEDSDSCDCPTVFSVDEQERALFPELTDVWQVTVWEDSQGFVMGSEVEA